MPSSRDTLPQRPDRALIDPAGCIGCTKCLPACPVDAILGARLRLHAVLAEACTGCGLCLPPCPTNCISLVPVDPGFRWPEDSADDQTAAHAFLANQAQREAERIALKKAREIRGAADSDDPYVTPPSDPEDLRQALQAARARARPRKSQGTVA